MAAGSDCNCDVDPACGGVHAELRASPDSSLPERIPVWETLHLSSTRVPRVPKTCQAAKARVAATLVQGLAAAATACLISSYMGWKVGSGLRMKAACCRFHGGLSDSGAQVDLESAGPVFMPKHCR